MQSNLFELREDGQIVMSPLRSLPSVPIIKFGEHFHAVCAPLPLPPPLMSF
jgi:hypothetical protein